MPGHFLMLGKHFGFKKKKEKPYKNAWIEI